MCVCVCDQLIKEGKKYADLTEVAKLFNLHGEDQVKDAGDESQSTEADNTATS